MSLFNLSGISWKRSFFKTGVLVLALAFVICSFAACSSDDSDDGRWIEGAWYQLDGTWVSEFSEVFDIDVSNHVFESDNREWPGFGYSGNIAGTMLFDAHGTNGVMIIKLNPDHGLTVYPATGAYYTGVFFRNRTADEMMIALSSEGTFPNAFTPVRVTLEAARDTFTVDTMSLYAAIMSATTKE